MVRGGNPHRLLFTDGQFSGTGNISSALVDLGVLGVTKDTSGVSPGSVGLPLATPMAMAHKTRGTLWLNKDFITALHLLTKTNKL